MHASIPWLSSLYGLTVMDILHGEPGDQTASGDGSLTLTAALTSLASASMDSKAFNLWRGRDLSRVLAAIPSSSSSSSESHSCGCGTTCWHPCRPQLCNLYTSLERADIFARLCLGALRCLLKRKLLLISRAFHEKEAVCVHCSCARSHLVTNLH